MAKTIYTSHSVCMCSMITEFGVEEEREIKQDLVSAPLFAALPPSCRFQVELKLDKSDVIYCTPEK